MLVSGTILRLISALNPVFHPASGTSGERASVATDAIARQTASTFAQIRRRLLIFCRQRIPLLLASAKQRYAPPVASGMASYPPQPWASSFSMEEGSTFMQG